MFGIHAFGECAFSEAFDTPLDSSTFQAFLDDVKAERCWIVEIDAFSLAALSARSSAFGDSGFSELGFADADAGVTGGVQTLRFSSHGYISRIFTGGVAGGDPADRNWYDGRLLADTIKVDRRLAGRNGIGGLTRIFAELELLNGDGVLDSLSGNYALDGRRVQIWIGRPTWRRSDYGLVFSGVVQTFRVGLTTAHLSMSDGIAKLEVAVNDTVYLGTGGNEGGADMKGKPKPKGWGSSLNISPPLVDSTNLIYQVNDGAISDVPAAYDRQVALTKVGGAPAAGQYLVDATLGTIKLGATPAGTVTCDLLGDASGAGYVAKTGEIVTRLLALAGLATSEIDSTALANLNSAQPATVGDWAGTAVRMISSVIDGLLAGIGAFGGFTRQGAFTVGIIASASGRTPVASYTEEHILDLEREALPSVVEPIAWRTSVGYQQNYTVQSDLAAAVTAARRTFAAEPQRVVRYEDSSIQSRYLLAQEFEVKGFFAQSADADTEANRLYGLWAVRREQYRVRLPITALTRDVGQVITLTHSRHGFSAGRNVRILGYSLDQCEIELRVLV